jgi:hypothetical protein
MGTGITWIDYGSKKIAIRASRKETEPVIFSFGNLQNYELLEGNRSVFNGLAVGFGPFSIASIRQTDYLDSLTVRVVFADDKTGANSLSIPVFKLTKIAQAAGGSSVKTTSTSYQVCLECAQAMMDELRNI